MSKRNAKQYPAVTITMCGGALEIAQNADGTITITLTGRIAANLHKAADAMNTVPWCDDDNTAATVLANFVLWELLNWGEGPRHNEYSGVSDETAYIVDGIDTGAGDDEELEKKRKDELNAAFDKAFRFVSFQQAMAKRMSA